MNVHIVSYKVSLYDFIWGKITFDLDLWLLYVILYLRFTCYEYGYMYMSNGNWVILQHKYTKRYHFRTNLIILITCNEVPSDKRKNKLKDNWDNAQIYWIISHLSPLILSL